MEKIAVRTHKHTQFIRIDDEVQGVIDRSGVREGLCHVFVPHTTAGITINENADPTVQSDILREMDKIVPWGDTYDHDEGNSAAHIKASLFGSSQTMFVSGGKLQLGTWQGIYLAEFDGPRTRQVWVKIIAD